MRSLALDAEALARTPSPPLRAAAATLGRALLRTGAQLFPDATPITSYRAASARDAQRPSRSASCAAAAGLTAADAALVALYDDAATVAAAAVKLLPVDAGAAPRLGRAAVAAELGALARAAAAPRASCRAARAPLVELRSLAPRPRPRGGSLPAEAPVRAPCASASADRSGPARAR